MARDDGPAPRAAGQWGLVAMAWLAVLAPLGWGIWNTLVKASALFRQGTGG